MKKISIPSIILGEKKEGIINPTKYHTEKGEVELHLPSVTDEDINKIKGVSDIHDIPLKDIISFYDKVGRLWSRKNYDLRKEALALTELVTGYSTAMVDHAHTNLSEMLSKKNMENIVDSDLNNRQFLEEWIKVGDIFVHAQPRGRVLHILAGNAPTISAVSMIRGSLTKNVNILKVASGDPVTSVYLASSFRDVDKDHPITKTTSVVYWKHNSEIEDKFIRISNALCVWGGKDAVESIRQKSVYGVELLEFGPKRSMQLIGQEAFKDSKTLKYVTDKISHDIVLFDQEACHSPQFVFVEGDVEKFCEVLSTSLDEEGKRLPRGFVHHAKHASISHERLMAKFYGEKIYVSKGTEWTLIITDNLKRTLRHPLGRTLYVFKIDHLKNALKYIDSTVQSVAIYPNERINELRDEITLNGADRVTHIGKMGYFAPGAPHDSIYPLSRLVRWVKSR